MLFKFTFALTKRTFQLHNIFIFQHAVWAKVRFIFSSSSKRLSTYYFSCMRFQFYFLACTIGYSAAFSLKEIERAGIKNRDRSSRLKLYVTFRHR